MSGTVTPNFRLQKPPFDTIPWDQAINGNMDIIDSTLAKYLTIPNFLGLWLNSTAYVAGVTTMDSLDGTVWQCVTAHTSPATPTTFSQARAATPGQWTPGAVITPIPPLPASVPFRNVLHNPMALVLNQGADINNPGNPATLNNQFVMDRWRINVALDTISGSIYTMVDSDRTAIGDESATNGIRVIVTGNAGAGSYSALIQNMEDVRRLAGKTVTVSFWAWNLTGGNRKIGVALLQNFGSGGSADVQINGTPVTITTTPARYSVTITLPTSIGKTVLGNNHTRLQLFMSSGSTTDPISGFVGVQSGTFTFWGLQLEVSGSASALEKIDPAYDAANCKRFYQLAFIRQYGYTSVGVVTRHTMLLPVQMRTNPSAVISPGGSTITNISSFTIVGEPSSVNMGGTATATGAYVMNFGFAIDSSL